MFIKRDCCNPKEPTPVPHTNVPFRMYRRVCET